MKENYLQANRNIGIRAAEILLVVGLAVTAFFLFQNAYFSAAKLCVVAMALVCFAGWLITHWDTRSKRDSYLRTVEFAVESSLLVAALSLLQTGQIMACNLCTIAMVVAVFFLRLPQER